MKSAITNKKTKNKTNKKISLKAYFPNDELVKRLNALSDESGLSVSMLTGLAIRYGLPKIEQGIHSIVAEDVKPKK